MWTSHWPQGRPKGWCTPQTPVVSWSCTRQRRPSWLDAARTFRILGTPQGPLKLSVWSAGGDGAVRLTFILRQSLSLNFQLSNWQHWLASKLQGSVYLCPASTGLQMGSTNTQVRGSKLQASRVYVTERAVSQPHVLFKKRIETYDPRDHLYSAEARLGPKDQRHTTDTHGQDRHINVFTPTLTFTRELGRRSRYTHCQLRLSY